MLQVFYIFVLTLAALGTAHAQEAVAATPGGTQSTELRTTVQFQALTGIIEALGNELTRVEDDLNARLADAEADLANVKACNVLGKVFDPSNPVADISGCVGKDIVLKTVTSSRGCNTRYCRFNMYDLGLVPENYQSFDMLLILENTGAQSSNCTVTVTMDRGAPSFSGRNYSCAYTAVVPGPDGGTTQSFSSTVRVAVNMETGGIQVDGIRPQFRADRVVFNGHYHVVSDFDTDLIEQ